MARPTQAEIDDFNARMNEPEEEDDDFEIVLFDESGNPVSSMPYKKAKTYLKKRGIDLDDIIPDGGASGNVQPDGNTGGKGNPTPGSSSPPASRSTYGYFGGNGRKRVPVNTDSSTVPPAG